MLKDEYISEQTELLSRLLQTILFPKSSGGFDLEKYPFVKDCASLQLQLHKLIDENKYNEAENMLFDAIEKDNGQDTLQLAVWFYDKLNRIDEKTLEEHDFSCGEVLEGIQEIEKIATGM